jgi:pimeloyl-ACP methyl ester carboxylesterase
MPKAFVNGINLCYQRQSGDGPELVLIHGLATNLAFWYFRVVPLLVRDFCLTMFDLRGHGQSDTPASGYTTADMATDLHALLEHLDIRRAHLVGHSYGGAVALHYTVLHPERIASLTLADTRIQSLQPTQRLKDWPKSEMWTRILKELGLSGPLDDPEMGYRLLEFLAELSIAGKEVNTLPVDLFSPFGFSKRSHRTANQWLRLLRTTTARSDFTALTGLTREQICQITLPVMAIFGEFSNCLPSCWALKRCLPQCSVVIVPQSGHFHPVVRPRFFTRALHEFLTTIAV